MADEPSTFMAAYQAVGNALRIVREVSMTAQDPAVEANTHYLKRHLALLKDELLELAEAFDER